jgi:hypothetical protein
MEQGMPKTWNRVGVIVKKTVMKKFRMMLPALAVVFAVAGAIAGDLLPSSQGRYKITASSCSAQLTTDQDCFRSDVSNLPICTITVNSVPNQAFQNSDCSGVLRYNP